MSAHIHHSHLSQTSGSPPGLSMELYPDWLISQGRPEQLHGNHPTQQEGAARGNPGSGHVS